MGREVAIASVFHCCMSPQQTPSDLLAHQQLKSSALCQGLLTAVSTAYRAATGEHKQDQKQQQAPQHTQQQEQPDPDDPFLRRPVPPPQHEQQDDCYFWSGSRTSAAAAAVGGGSSSAGHGGAAAAGGDAVSMDTSATTRVPRDSQGGPSELLSTAKSPVESWGARLSRLKQLQLETREALLEVQ